MDILQKLDELKSEARTALLNTLRSRIHTLRSRIAAPPLKTLSLHRAGTETINRPQYAKWAKTLLEGKPLRLLTTQERSVCFIPSSVFQDNGGMPIGSLILTYGGGLYQGYVELDFGKKPNPYYLKMNGFPLTIGILICQIIYAMFPHLNPLTEDDIRTLNASKTRRGAKNALRLTAPKRKHVKVSQNPTETKETALECGVPAPAQEKPIAATEINQDYVRHSTKQPETKFDRKARRKSTKGSEGSGKARKSGGEKLPDVQGGEPVRDSGQS